MGYFLVFFIVLIVACAAVVAVALRRKNVHIWLASYTKKDWRAQPVPGVTRHLMFAFVDHFEPMYGRPDYAVECARVARWRQDYPKLCEGIRDADGRSPIHTFFYPQEEYRPEHIEPLVELSRMGIGEIEIHLHHHDDTEQGLRDKLREFTQILANNHDALPRDPRTGQLRWAFIHGNWALCNSDPTGANCGVNNELVILREEGCYADFTFPAAPHPCQTSTVNQIYYATDKPGQPKSHDTGVPVRVGTPASGDLMIIQGPSGFMHHNRKFGIIPRIENADVRTTSPAVPERIDSWVNTGIHVRGKPEWVFVKLHTHGVEERDIDTLLGPSMRRAYEYLSTRYNDGKQWKLHFVSAREMYNIIKAAEAGEAGEPGQYRDYIVPRPGYRAQRKAA
ncbi:MAG: hypothetical protein ACRCV9_09900 [Burkholderiaceae bacterium]